MTLLIATILLGGLGYGYLSRMCGGAPPKLPLGLDQWLYAIPYGVVAYLAVANPSVAIAAAVLSYFGAFLGKRTGHGQWFSLGEVVKAIEPEKLDFVATAFFGEDPRCFEKFKSMRGKNINDYTNDELAAIYYEMVKYGETKLYWRCVFGLGVSGLAVGLLAGGTLIATGHTLAGLVLIVGASLKGFAYPIGRWLDVNINSKNSEWDEPTEWGEFLTGLFGWLGITAALVSLGVV